MASSCDNECEIASLNDHFLNLYKCMIGQIQRDEKPKGFIKSIKPNCLFFNGIYTAVNFIIEGMTDESKIEMEKKNKKC